MAVTFDPVFDGLPPTQRPVNRTTVNESMAGGLVNGRKRVLLVVPSTGSAADKTLDEGVTMTDALALYGPIAYSMLKSIFKVNPLASVDVLPVKNTTGTAASGTITFATTATEDGEGEVRMGDHRTTFAFLKDDTAAEIAAACAAAIEADTYAPFSAAAVDEVVTLTCERKGTLGNYYNLGCTMPTSNDTTAVVVQPSSGATDTAIDDTVTDVYKSKDYDVIVGYYAMAGTTLSHCAEVGDFMLSGNQNRGALHINGAVATLANLYTFLGNLNRKDFSVPLYESTLGWWTPIWDVAAMEAGYLAAESNPSIPFMNERRPYIERDPAIARPYDYDTVVENIIERGGTIYDWDEQGPFLVRHISTKKTLATGTATRAYQSVHVFFTEKALRQDILQDQKDSAQSGEAKKLVDGRYAERKGRAMARLYYRATEAGGLWVSLAELEKYKGGVTAGPDPDDYHRGRLTIPLNIIQDYTGTDTEMYIMVPSGGANNG